MLSFRSLRIALGSAFVFTTAVLQAQTLVYGDVHQFGGTVNTSYRVQGHDGWLPSSGVTPDQFGNLYGTVAQGGLFGGGHHSAVGGLVYEQTTFGTYRDVHDFGGTVQEVSGAEQLDGDTPFGEVAFDASGNVYGTTFSGGRYGVGVVWEFTKNAQYRILHNFGGTIKTSSGEVTQDGAYPRAGVVFDKKGNMYGTTYAGGPNSSNLEEGSGIVWRITPSGSYKDLHDFGGTVTNANGFTGPDGVNPIAGVTVDASSNLYGTCAGGGPNSNVYGGYGMVWEITATNHYKDLHDFGGQVVTSNGIRGGDGEGPVAGVTVDEKGNLYGTTEAGGANYAKGKAGMVWEIAAGGSYKDLHDFGGTVVNTTGATGADGYNPVGAVTLDPAGNLYGTTSYGGAYTTKRNHAGCGLVWEITNKKTYLDLHDFGVNMTFKNGQVGPEAAYPSAGVVLDSFGTLYGTTTYGGPYNTVNGGDGLIWTLGTEFHSVSMSPNAQVGGPTSTGTITLVQPAPAGGLTVKLSSNSSYITVPSSVTLREGATSVKFNATTVPVTSIVNATITATVGNVVRTTPLTLDPAILHAISVGTGSSSSDATSGLQGTILFDGPAPDGGAQVTLVSSNPSLVTVPTTVEVPSGSDTATFNLSTATVTSPQVVTITATCGRYKLTYPLTLAP